MDRLTQLAIERKLLEGLAALPLSTRTILSAWYENAINDVETGREKNETNQADLNKTMEAINYAIRNIRKGG